MSSDGLQQYTVAITINLQSIGVLGHQDFSFSQLQEKFHRLAL